MIVRALRSFAWGDGVVRRGTRFRVNERDAARLERAGLAVRLQRREPERVTVGPTETKHASVPVPVPLGGGWYLVRGEKVQGRERADALARGDAE